MAIRSCIVDLLCKVLDPSIVFTLAHERYRVQGCIQWTEKSISKSHNYPIIVTPCAIVEMVVGEHNYEAVQLGLTFTEWTKMPATDRCLGSLGNPDRGKSKEVSLTNL